MTSDKVITLGASTEDVTLYVANGVTVTLTGTVSGGNVIIKAADSSAKNCISDDSTKLTIAAAAIVVIMLAAVALMVTRNN